MKTSEYRMLSVELILDTLINSRWIIYDDVIDWLLDENRVEYYYKENADKTYKIFRFLIGKNMKYKIFEKMVESKSFSKIYECMDDKTKKLILGDYISDLIHDDNISFDIILDLLSLMVDEVNIYDTFYHTEPSKISTNQFTKLIDILFKYKDGISYIMDELVMGTLGTSIVRTYINEITNDQWDSIICGASVELYKGYLHDFMNMSLYELCENPEYVMMLLIKHRLSSCGLDDLYNIVFTKIMNYMNVEVNMTCSVKL